MTQVALLANTDRAASELADTWMALEPYVEEALQRRKEVARDPRIGQDPWIVALVRWLALFETDLTGIEKVYRGLQSGGKVTPEQIQGVRDRGEDLLHAIRTAKRVVAEPNSSASP